MIKGTLVLEGGGSRGIFTAGVLDYFMENDIYFSDVVGVSSGACNAVDYVSKQPGRSKDCIIVKKRSRRYIYKERIMTTFEAIDLDKVVFRFADKDFPFDFETYSNSDINCYVGTTNSLTGEAEYFNEKEDRQRFLETVRASCSLPLVCKPQNIDGIDYFDGGVKENIPINFAKTLGNEKIVIVLTKTMDDIKTSQSIIEQDVFLRMYRGYPFLCADYLDMPRRNQETYNELTKLEEEGKIFIIRPTDINVDIATTDTDELEEFYDHGYKLTKALHSELDKYLKSQIER